jgi:hypothetical protein
MGEKDIIMKKEVNDLIRAIHGDGSVMPKEFGGLASAFPHLAAFVDDGIDEDRALFGEEFLAERTRIERQIEAADALAVVLRRQLLASSGLPHDIYKTLKAYEATK